jgi:hypothetical protein
MAYNPYYDRMAVDPSQGPAQYPGAPAGAPPPIGYNPNPQPYFSTRNGQQYLRPSNELGLKDQDGNEISLKNPGQIDLQQANPDLWAQLERMKGLQGQFSQFSSQYLDPNRYASRRSDAMMRADVGAQNRAARMGLAGSSAAFGASDEAVRQAGFSWDDREMNDNLRATQMEQMLNGDVTKTIMGGQAAYGAFQQQYVDLAMGAEAQNAQASSQNASMWGGILSAIGTIGGAAAGFAVGGPAGAYAGGAAGGALGHAAGGALEIGYDQGDGNWVPDTGQGIEPTYGNFDPGSAYDTWDGNYAPGYF